MDTADINMLNCACVNTIGGMAGVALLLVSAPVVVAVATVSVDTPEVDILYFEIKLVQVLVTTLSVERPGALSATLLYRKRR